MILRLAEPADLIRATADPGSRKSGFFQDHRIDPVSSVEEDGDPNVAYPVSDELEELLVGLGLAALGRQGPRSAAGPALEPVVDRLWKTLKSTPDRPILGERWISRC